eukprot:CAMPEP_0177682174 /NCGR_PEP_ID=MMETSP0447-20121125/31115_1 /TAXON_ID=0 /ORGANISM="Stygamoeba regulata, Strain BSH-02190019" /LENGTH=192 /DNA_ID=CAMNT_0019191653 /DNA_START=134 /DNA_END=712 /DNA_ORIENTATION=+
MKGKNCVVIGSDTRYGLQAQTIATDFPKTFKMTDQCYVGLVGLATDVQTIRERLQFRLKLYSLKEEREMEPVVVGNVISSILYERRFGPYFVEPVVAGLQGPEKKPYICAMDLIGAPVFADDFVVSGTSAQALYGLAETLYKPDMDEEDLFETVSQCLLAAVNRDAVSGWGASVTIITPDRIITRTLKGRHD